MSIKNKIVITAMAGLALGVSSCRKYLDVNENPNMAHEGTVTTLLPAAQLHLGSAMGADLQVNGSIWSQFWTQSPDGKQYVSFDQFSPSAEAYNDAWRNLYAGASNFYQLQKMSEEQFKGQYRAIALLMQAYTFQVLADGWNDVPFSEALQGQYVDGHVVNPKYDSQKVVLRGVVKYIDSAMNVMKTGGGVTPGSDDLIYGGNMAKWQKFANTLKLRTLVRMSRRDSAYARRKMDSLFLTNPQFIGEGDDAVIAYGGNAGNANPLYAELTSMEMGGVQQLAGSKTCIDTMLVNGDPRALVFYTTVPSLGPVGIKQSEYDVKLPAGSFSTPSAYVGADIMNAASAKAPVVLLSSWESYFLQAEVFAKGIAVGNDEAMFYAGIHANLMFYNAALQAEAGINANTAYTSYTTPGASYWGRYPVTGTWLEKTRHIITQKWFSMCGNQGFEAWTEWRRTGFPDFLVTPKNSHLGTMTPRRLVYPSSERASNSKYPGEQPVTKNVWWDVTL